MAGKGMYFLIPGQYTYQGHKYFDLITQALQLKHLIMRRNNKPGAHLAA